MADQLDFLRATAKQCREFARDHDGATASALMTMADDLEANAELVEREFAALLAGPTRPH
ncbi:MAG: hypothetical protein HY060_27045 [Proteobacteria bacterium]|nr:hypothetical protein [Pseudomonadota bacterium]